MPKIRTTVDVKLTGLKKFHEALGNDLRSSESRPIREGLHESAVIFARFLVSRWLIFSMGGGNWKALKIKTLAHKIKLGLLPLILRATDTLFEAFNPEFARKPGKISEDIPYGVRIGFGSNMQYPHSTKSGVTMTQLVMYHQTGAGHLPVRKIVVPPDAETKKKMRDAIQQGVQEAAHQ